MSENDYFSMSSALPLKLFLSKTHIESKYKLTFTKHTFLKINVKQTSQNSLKSIINSSKLGLEIPVIRHTNFMNKLFMPKEYSKNSNFIFSFSSVIWIRSSLLCLPTKTSEDELPDTCNGFLSDF